MTSLRALLAATRTASLGTRLRRLLPAVLLLAALTPMTAQGQEQVTVQVPLTWQAIPDDSLEVGDSFRLMFVAKKAVNAVSSDIDTYNAIAVKQANGTGTNAAGSLVKQYGTDNYRALVATADRDAHYNTRTHPYHADDTHQKIYWVNGEKVADDYIDFYNGFDSREARFPDGSIVPGIFRWYKFAAMACMERSTKEWQRLSWS